MAHRWILRGDPNSWVSEILLVHDTMCNLSRVFQAWNRLCLSLGAVCAHTLGALDVCTMATEGS